MNKFLIINTTLTTLSVFFLLGCNSKKHSTIAKNIINRTWTETQVSPLEKIYCKDTITYTSSYLISGQATYEYRPIGTEPDNEGLLDIAEDTRPIRHAQYEVVDTSGRILQCGETNSSGNFSFNVPKSGKALSLNIYARSNNSFNRASVFIAPETNELHKIQHFFTANGNQSNINLVAEGDRTVVGGAFNILDQIHNSFDVLKTSVVPEQGIDPLNIPKVDIYWEKGFNPGVYTGTSSGTSFLSKPQMKIFILGGLNGDVDFTDTDHFDNSIILHEYFHFLESSISVSHTPGGSHNGNEILDPRLAWSEGAGQFYQAFITNIPAVLDTRGNSDGSTGFYIKRSIENEGLYDVPVYPGEGEFREFAVARLLWDIHDTENEETAPEEFDNISGYFPNFWQAFSNKGSQADFNHEKSNLASIGLLLEIIDFLTPIRDNSHWNTLLTHSRMTQPMDTPVNTFRAQYGQGLGSGVTTSFSFKGPYEYRVNPSLPNNHPLLSIDYYALRVAPLTTETISVTSTTTGHVTGKEGHVQLYIFKSTYQNLNDYIHGPINENVDVDLHGGLNGATYMIAVVISTLPEQNPSSTTISIDYEFPNFTKESF